VGKINEVVAIYGVAMSIIFILFLNSISNNVIFLILIMIKGWYLVVRNIIGNSFEMMEKYIILFMDII
jgi:hypothetical protein